DRDVSGIPFAGPDTALRIGPGAARAGARIGRLDDGGGAGRGVDPPEIAAGERGEIDALRRCSDAVGTGAARRLPDFERRARHVEPAVDAVLAGEPQNAGAIEGGGVEIGEVAPGGQREA